MSGFRKGTKRKSMSDRCDQLFRALIRERDEICQAGNLCFGVYCGGPLDVAHFAPRRSRSVRWSAFNAALLCRNHHRWIDSHELDKWEWVRSFLGDEKYEELRVAMRQTWDKDYDAVLERLKERAA